MNNQSEPILNVPAVVVALIAAFAIVHLGRTYLLSADGEIEFLLNFAFIPGRYDEALALRDSFPGGTGAEIWTFVTYAFIHADLTHLAVNSIWLLPFGSAVARRFGPMRFLAFFAVTAAAGALAHLATHRGVLFPMIGASAAVSGCMAGAIRFAFQRGGPLDMMRRHDDAAYRVPAVPLLRTLSQPPVLAFLAVWFALNILFGLGSVTLPGVEQAVAWEAHLGGFLAGLVLFAMFDPAVVHTSMPDENG